MSINNVNRFLNIEDSHLRVVNGNVHAQALNIGGITVGSAHGLQSITNVSNITSNTVQFNNATTGLVTTANVQVGGELTVSGNVNVEGTITSNIPAFSAYESDEYSVTAAGYITLGNTFVNRGGCYDTSTGKFTAPITGTYYFTADCVVRAGTGSGNSTWTFHINDANFNPTSTTRPIVYQSIDTGNHSAVDQSTSGSLIVTLNANDTFRIRAQDIPSNTNQNWGQGYGRFMGYLIS
jgi:hypothetical protein